MGRGRPRKIPAQMQAQDEQDLSREVELEAYHKGNYTNGKAPAQGMVKIQGLCSTSVYMQITNEARREKRSVEDHISWLIESLYHPPAMTSDERAKSLAWARISRG